MQVPSLDPPFLSTPTPIPMSLTELPLNSSNTAEPTFPPFTSPPLSILSSPQVPTLYPTTKMMVGMVFYLFAFLVIFFIVFVSSSMTGYSFFFHCGFANSMKHHPWMIYSFFLITVYSIIYVLSNPSSTKWYTVLGISITFVLLFCLTVRMPAPWVLVAMTCLFLTFIFNQTLTTRLQSRPFPPRSSLQTLNVLQYVFLLLFLTIVVGYNCVSVVSTIYHNVNTPDTDTYVDDDFHNPSGETEGEKKKMEKRKWYTNAFYRSCQEKEEKDDNNNNIESLKKEVAMMKKMLFPTPPSSSFHPQSSLYPPSSTSTLQSLPKRQPLNIGITGITSSNSLSPTLSSSSQSSSLSSIRTTTGANGQTVTNPRRRK